MSMCRNNVTGKLRKRAPTKIALALRRTSQATEQQRDDEILFDTD